MKVCCKSTTRRSFAAIAVLTIATGLPGCAFIPPLQANLNARSIESIETSRSLSGPQENWPNSEWWRSYKDPQLDLLVDQALRDSPNLALANARLRLAGAGIELAKGSLIPQVVGSAQFSQDKQSYNYLMPRGAVPQGWKDYGRITLDFAWDVDFWGKNRSALAAATSDLAAARAEQAQARLVLSAAVVSAYAELAHLYSALDTASAALVVRQKSVDLVTKRYRNGLDTLATLRQIESRATAAEADVLALEEQISLAKNGIAALVGAGPDRGLEISRPIVVVSNSPGLPQTLALQLLGRRPDIVAARLQVDAAGKRIDQHKAEFYPNINLMALVGVHALGLNMLTKNGSNIGSVGPAISLPIFNTKRLEGQLDGAYAIYDSAIANYNATLMHALNEVADAATSRRQLVPQLYARNQAYLQAREAHAVAIRRYEGGLSTYLDVLAAEDQMLWAQRALSEMQTRAFSLDVALVRSLGGGYRTEEPERDRT